MGWGGNRQKGSDGYLFNYIQGHIVSGIIQLVVVSMCMSTVISSQRNQTVAENIYSSHSCPAAVTHGKGEESHYLHSYAVRQDRKSHVGDVYRQAALQNLHSQKIVLRNKQDLYLFFNDKTFEEER